MLREETTGPVPVDDTSNTSKKQKCEKGYEKQRINNALGNFKANSSRVWHALQVRFGSRVAATELLSIALVAYKYSNGNLPEPGRLEKRSKKVLLKWYCDNWPMLEPIIARINLLDENLQAITLARELAPKK